MARSPQDNTNFASSMIARMTEAVQRVEAVTPYSFLVHTEKFPPARVGVLSINKVEASDVQKLLDADPRVEFIANIPKVGVWQGSAIQLLQEKGIAFGPVKHLMGAISGRRDEEPLNDYEHAETKYFKTILSQHKNLHHLVRVTDLIYEFHRKNGESVLIAGLNDYELTGVMIRAAVAQHGHVSIIFATNPNGGPTPEAYDAANSMGIELYDQRNNFYRRLHTP